MTLLGRHALGNRWNHYARAACETQNRMICATYSGRNAQRRTNCSLGWTCRGEDVGSINYGAQLDGMSLSLSWRAAGEALEGLSASPAVAVALFFTAGKISPRTCGNLG